MKFMRLKAGTSKEQIENRMQFSPEILELHLTTEDLLEPSKLIQCIQNIQVRGTKVYLHHPILFGSEPQDIMSDDPIRKMYYLESSRLLAQISSQTGVKCVVHAHYAGTTSSDFLDKEHTQKMRGRIEEILSFSGDALLWEDTIEGLFSYANPYLIDEIIKPLNLPLIVDVSHSFISLRGDNQKLRRVMEDTQRYVRYFHVVDSKGLNHDSLPIGEGGIDWNMMIPYLLPHDFIFEIGLSDFNSCKEMIDSVRTFNQLID